MTQLRVDEGDGLPHRSPERSRSKFWKSWKMLSFLRFTCENEAARPLETRGGNAD